MSHRQAEGDLYSFRVRNGRRFYPDWQFAGKATLGTCRSRHSRRIMAPTGTATWTPCSPSSRGLTTISRPRRALRDEHGRLGRHRSQRPHGLVQLAEGFSDARHSQGTLADTIAVVQKAPLAGLEILVPRMKHRPVTRSACQERCQVATAM